MPTRIAVLVSGGGTNLQAILDYFAGGDARRCGEIVLVASDRTTAGALDRARARGIPAVTFDASDDGESLEALLDAHQVAVVALAGYIRLVPPAITRRFKGRMVNVHPALLPAFGGPGMYGRRIHRAVLDGGARVTGCTVHFVDEAYDHGPAIAQWPVPVVVGDTPETLAARVLRVEHVLYPRVLEAVAASRIVLDADGRVRGGFHADAATAMFALDSLEEDALARNIHAALGR